MTLRVGLIGCGFQAAVHARSMAALARAGLVDAAVVATHDPDRSRAEALAGLSGAEVVDGPEAVVAGADAVFVCTPTGTHRALVEVVAAGRTALFCEKPLATSLPDAEAMEAAVAGIPSQVGLVLRFAPAYAALAGLVAAGSLGRPLAAILRDDQYWPIQGQYGSTWRGDAAMAGGGTLLEHSIHDLDVLAWLLGPAERVSGRTVELGAHPGVEDVAVATLAFASGAVATLTSVWHQVLSRPSNRWLEVLCEHGVVNVVHEWAGPLTVTTSGGAETVACPPPAWVAELRVEDPWWGAVAAYAPQALAFLTALAAGDPPAPGFGVAVAAHRLADALYRSAAAGGVPTGP